MAVYRIYYVFDSDLVDEKYEKFDGVDFSYDADIEDVKDWFIWDYKKRLDLDLCNSSEIKELLDEMDLVGEFDWNKALGKNYHSIRNYFKNEAMEWYVKEHEED